MKKYVLVCLIAMMFSLLQVGCFAEKGSNETFYGKWIVKAFITGGRGSSYDDTKVKSRLGKLVTFYREKAKCDGKVCKNPIYVKKVMTEDEFFVNYGYIAFSRLGYKQKNITGITIYETKDNEWNSFGSVIFIVDDKNLLLQDDLAFFRLVKTN